jgi:hypothetical protein
LNFGDKRRVGEWLANQFDTRVESVLMNDGVSRAACCEENQKLGAPATSFVGKLSPIHATRKPDICD